MPKVMHEMGGVPADPYIDWPGGKFDRSMAEEKPHRLRRQRRSELASNLSGCRLHEAMLYLETADGDRP